MLEKLFGNPVIEKILFTILINEECYGSQLQKIFDIPLYSIQKALLRLETAGVIVAQLKGKTRMYQFNSRYPFLEELKEFLKKAYDFLPEDIRIKYYEKPIRKRPRRAGKPLP